MLITVYNKHWNDVLICIMDKGSGDQSYCQKEDVVRIYDKKNNNTLGFNFLNIHKYINDIHGDGPISLNEYDIQSLNKHLSYLNFKDVLYLDNSPKFVIGYVTKCIPHPNSDHMHICTVDVGKGKTLQIVCGASNIAKDEKVVVSLIGAVMPSGKIIWPSKLRGINSNGMICSSYELGLTDHDEEHRILVINDDLKIGSKFNFNN